MKIWVAFAISVTLLLMSVVAYMISSDDLRIKKSDLIKLAVWGIVPMVFIPVVVSVWMWALDWH